MHNDVEIRRAAIVWLRKHRADPKWQYVAEPLAVMNPRDPELLEIARGLLDGNPRATINWAAASKILSNAGESPCVPLDVHKGTTEQDREYRNKQLSARRDVNRLVQQGQLQEAEQYLIRLIETSAQEGDDVMRGIGLTELGGVLRKTNREADARAVLHDALELFTHKTPHALARSAALHKLGDLCHQERRWIEGEEAFRMAMFLRRALGEPIGYAISLNSLAEMHKDFGMHDAACAEGREAMDIFEQLGTDRQRAQCRALLIELGCGSKRLAEQRTAHETTT